MQGSFAIKKDKVFIQILNDKNKSLDCIDVDECAVSSHQCDVNSNCTNSIGAYSCDCLPGYTKIGPYRCMSKYDFYL